jgi:lipopolysaccharide biosynthesis protein
MICVFAHYDSLGRVKSSVVEYIRQLHLFGLKIFFVSNSSLDNASIEVLKDSCSLIVERKNYGFDFAAWQAVLGKLHPTKFVLFTNSSIVGPLSDLEQMLHRVVAVDADVVGAVWSNELSPHFQSWFFLVNKKVFYSQPFQHFFTKDFCSMDKKTLVIEGEVDLTSVLISAGFKVSTLWRPTIDHPLAGYNPTHFEWKKILDGGIPFVKADLIAKNPLMVSTQPDAVATATSIYKDLEVNIIPSSGHWIERLLSKNQLTERDLAFRSLAVRLYLKGIINSMSRSISSIKHPLRKKK